MPDKQEAKHTPARLREIADEISREGHNGWGNEIRDIADSLLRENEELRHKLETGKLAISAAIPMLFEHGHHADSRCYRTAADDCYCGLEDTKAAIAKWEKALASARRG